MPVHNIETVGDFEKILSENPTVIIDWFATWCGPCKAIAPLVVNLSNEDKYKDIFFGKIDVDVLESLAQKYEIKAMPTIQLFKNGEKVEDLVGPNPNTLQSFVAKAV